jgi:hypothetical protein
MGLDETVIIEPKFNFSTPQSSNNWINFSKKILTKQKIGKNFNRFPWKSI